MSAPPKTVDELLALHPWPREYASEPRMAPEMTFAERERVKIGLTRRAGMAQEWIEVPWNWVSEQWAEVTRVYSRGFGKVLTQIAEQLAALQPALSKAGPEALAPEAETKLQQVKAKLVGEGLDPACVTKLFEWLRPGAQVGPRRAAAAAGGAALHA